MTRLIYRAAARLQEVEISLVEYNLDAVVVDVDVVRRDLFLRIR